MFVLLKIWHALFSWDTLFKICPFALLLTSWHMTFWQKGALLSHYYLKEKIFKISALTFHSSKECCYFCCYILLFLYFYCYLTFLCFTQTGWNFFASQHTFTCLKTIEKLAKSMKYVQLTLKTPRRSRWRCSGVFSVDFENVLLLSLVFLLVTLNRQCFLVRDLSFRVKFFSEMLELVCIIVNNTWFFAEKYHLIHHDIYCCLEIYYIGLYIISCCCNFELGF